MKVVIISNYLNPHMVPLCMAFDSHPQIEEFYFIALTMQSEARKKMGFEDINKSYPFVCRAYESEGAYNKAVQLAEEADVAIVGEAPDEWVALRMRKNKLTFLQSERFYRRGLWRRFVPISYKKKKERFLQYKEKNLYYLTIGAYTPFDLYMVGFPMAKCFQWAYFPQIYNVKEMPKNNTTQPIQLLWAGSLTKVKHPEIVIKIAEKLKKTGLKFELNVIGSGPLYSKMEKMVKKRHLSNNVCLLGNCKPEKTQEYMAQSDIFLFTSDYGEGWGAVLNEAMAHGCVPIASYKAGASEILIQHGKNGFIYDNYREVSGIIAKLMGDGKQKELISEAAVKTVSETWEAGNAVKKFVQTVEKIRMGQIEVKSESKYGPMDNVVLRKAKNYFYTQ